MESSPSRQPSLRPHNHEAVPQSILVVGAGVFGLSTVLALLSSNRYDEIRITLIDPYLPSFDLANPSVAQAIQRHDPHAASIDSSRIIRPDYALPTYANLANEAHIEWRRGFGKGTDDQDVYRESGLALTAEKSGSDYVTRAGENARNLGFDVQYLKDRKDIWDLWATGGGSGETGYVNWGSGWADARKGMEGALTLALEKARKRGNVEYRRGKVQRLLFADDSAQKKVLGAVLDDGQEVWADLTIVAAGAWSGALLDLRGRAEARGQVMAYVPLTSTEAERLRKKPVLLNLTSGMFMIPPIQDHETGEWIIKVARHGYGYANPVSVSPEGKAIITSLPHSKFFPIPVEGETACRIFLEQTVPWLRNRPFSQTRICWYTDTPSGDFIVDYHPNYKGLFMATGGSGHGFKFLPVLGEKIVAAIEGRLTEDLIHLWQWPEKMEENFGGTEDGSRGGKKGMVLEEEWKQGRKVNRSKL